MTALNRSKAYLCNLVAILVFSCSNYSEVDLQVVQKIEKATQRPIDLERDLFLLIPARRCNNCLFETTVWCKENISEIDGLKVIFLNELGSKDLKIRVGELFLNHPRVFIDSLDEIRPQNTSVSFPTIVEFKNNRMVVRPFEAFSL
ncbi:hypothetical protein [Roseivirga pacifica]|uniref:hypothetical protein n=1 Tax=Roseivirga pacifica TaxID=1267423 RepID=UPI003BAEFB09